MKIHLASGSPRRAKILKECGVDFDVVKTDAPETAYPDDPARTVRENAILKGRAAAALLPPETRGILSADTIVWYGNKIYGKPRDLGEAKDFLRELSGRVHTVYTGVALDGETAVETSDVEFRPLSETEIDDYVATVKPTDRAGAYDIDESGDRIVARWTGEYENIMGLPLAPLRRWGLMALAGILAFVSGCASPAKPRFEDPYELNRPDCRIAVMADCDSEEISRKIYNRAEIVPFEEMRPAVWQLLAEKVDAFVFDEHVLRLIQWHYPDRFRILEEPLDTDPSVIAVSAKRPELREKLNRFIAQLRENGIYDEMFLRWCHDPERRPEDVPDVSAVICRDPKAPHLRVGVDPVQEPNAYIDKKGRLVGYDIEFAYRFGRAATYRIDFVQDGERELLQMLEAGELDVVISNLGKDPSRAGILWTDGYLDSDIKMMVKEK